MIKLQINNFYIKFNKQILFSMHSNNPWDSGFEELTNINHLPESKNTNTHKHKETQDIITHWNIKINKKYILKS